MAYRISDSCVGCGTCSSNCPASCITEGNPYTIDESACLDCGTCASGCPVEAISHVEE